MESLLRDLNPQQRQAVETTEGYVRVVAGAGSGKTRTLARRYAYLCSALGADPARILCVTFTNKAAAEMKKRIRSLLPDQDLGYITTFHGFCVTLLKEDCHVIQYPKTFLVMDNDDKEIMLKGIFETLGVTSRDTTIREMSDYIGGFKGTHDYVPQLITLSPQELLQLENRATGLKERIYYRYLYEQRKCFGLDFDDLVLVAVYLLHTDRAAREKWQQRIEYMMIDEYQDIDKDEYRLSELLTAYHKNLFVVGDPDQTIYTWRGADPTMILEFPKRHAPCETIFLNTNYRSVPQILSASNALIRQNNIRLEKDLSPVRPDGPKPLYFHGKTQKEEAGWIVAQMQALHAAGRPYSQLAVLYRAHYVSRTVEEALIAAKIPYTLYSGVEFYKRKEIKDVICYLRMLRSGDNLSFLRTVNEPRRNIGRKRIEFLKNRAEQNEISLYEALKASLEHPLFHGTKAMGYVRLVEKYRVLCDDMPLTDLMAKILEESGYETMLRTNGESDRLDNLSELKQSMLDYETTAGEEVSLDEWLERAALFSNLDQGERPDSVKLMTVHAAKGLEFPAVFLAGLSEGIFPTKRALTKEKLEEERRLCYVAMTRAQDRLYLSDAAGMDFEGGYRLPSRFLFNAGAEHVDFVRKLEGSLLQSVKDLVEQTEHFSCEAAPAKEDFSPQDRVRHPMLGDGTVLKLQSDTGAYLIQFDKFPTPRSIRREIQMERENITS